MAFSDLDHFKSRWLGSSFWMARLERLVMFRSSVAAFYALPRRHFYWCGYVLRGRFRSRCRRLQIPSEIKKIVHRMSQILFAAEIAFRRLHRCMPQQELNLLQLATRRRQFGLILCLRRTTASHAAGFQLRQTALAMHLVPMLASLG